MDDIDYVQMVLNEQYEIDSMFYECMEAQLEAEANFIFSCLENNIILEADENKTSNFWDRLIEIFTDLKNKFFYNTEKIIESNKEFVSHAKDNLDKINFEKLEGTLKIAKYWELQGVGNPDSTIPDKYTNDAYAMLTDAKKPKEEEISNLKSIDDVQKYGDFGKINIEGLKFAEAAKLRFLNGSDSKDKPTAQSIDLKTIRPILDKMLTYINDFNNKRVTRLQRDQNELINILRKIKRTGDTSTLAKRESFSLLENAYFKDTDLFYCINAGILTEAEEPAENKPAEGGGAPKPETNQQNNDKQPEGTVNINNKEEVNNSANSNNAYTTYYKHAARLAEIVMAAEMTVRTQIYKLYIKSLRSIINGALNKGNNNPENKQENNQEEKK